MFLRIVVTAGAAPMKHILNKLLSMNVGTYLMEVYCLTDTLKGRAVQSGLIPHPKKFARKEV